MPNTALVPIETNANGLIAHAKFIATLTGTTALEAALNGVPSIVFGTLGLKIARESKRLDRYNNLKNTKNAFDGR